MMKTAVKMALTVIILMAGTRGISQTTIPEILENGTLREQMNYLEEKTRIYENYRAIREDMFQLIKRNSIDSLAKVRRQVAMLAGMNSNLVARIDSLTADVSDLRTRLDEAVRTKESISVLGMNINKNVYNSFMWIIIVALLFLLGMGFLIFKRNLSVMLNTKKELEELKTEFEAYRQKKRVEIEKMGMDHFNEIRKLRGG
jgi:cell division protein FtsB